MKNAHESQFKSNFCSMNLKGLLSQDTLTDDSGEDQNLPCVLLWICCDTEHTSENQSA